jgi:pimeloyl-ACP methyl ester carboxylesterase
LNHSSQGTIVTSIHRGVYVMNRLVVMLVLFTTILFATPAAAEPEDHFASNASVKIHYVAEGSGPLVVMLHGFPGFWYSWSPLMSVLKDKYRVVALDMRGYNLSDKPEGVDAYKFANLIGDVAAVIAAEGEKNAMVIGHDWGAAVAWQVALNRPDLVNHLIVMSVPHPAGFAREMASNADQQKNSQYARDFLEPGAEKMLTAEGLAAGVSDPADRAKYVEAYRRSDFTAMLNYYRANYPRNTDSATVLPPLPHITVPVLVIHGLKDQALNAKGHSGTWDWVDADTTLLMIPSAGHFVQFEAAALVNRTVRDWLDARP